MFLAGEIDEIKELLPADERKSGEDLKMYLTDFEYNFLKNQNRLSTVSESVKVFPHNKYRPYTSIRITKFIDDNETFYNLLESILNTLSAGYLLFCDFHFLIVGVRNDGETPDFLGENLKLQTASKMSHLNETVSIDTAKDAENILAQFRDMNVSDLLNASFVNHSELYEYQSSGLRPHQLLSAVFHLQKFIE